MANQRRVGILCGGRSAEHEISLISGMNIAGALDHAFYEPVIIAIARDGKWYLQDEGQFLSGSRNPKQVRIPKFSRPLGLIPGAGRGSQLFDLASGKMIEPLEVVFPILHGPFGEDGSMQGMLKQLDIPFVGPSVLGSAVGMDKELMKRLLTECGIANAKYVCLRKSDSEQPDFDFVFSKLGLPMFVKPANMGSSVGISKIKSASEFQEAIQLAFTFDDKILIEEFIEGREIECAVLGNEKVLASIPGEIVPQAEFYTYEAKYLDDKGAILEAPAKNLSESDVIRIQNLAIQVFKSLECEGLSRVDFFLCKDGKIYVNEINTLPGFTRISMYPRLWELSGIEYPELLDRLIRLAIERHGKERILSVTQAL